jgi:hypothetical protein
MKRVYILYTCCQLSALYFSLLLGEDVSTTTTPLNITDPASNSTNATSTPVDSSNSTSTNATDILDTTDTTVEIGDTLDNKTDTAVNMTHMSADASTCVHEGHDATIDPQTTDPGIFMSIEIINDIKIILHLHAKESFKGIMISTAEEGNFTIPDDMPLKLMNTSGCTGVTNSDETEKDHVMVNFEKKSESSIDPVFNIVLVRAQDTYWSGITFPEVDEKVEDSHKMTEHCVHPGHDTSIPSQQNEDSGVVITSDTLDNSTITLHIHADDNPFKGIMIYTEAKGNFTVPEGNVMKLMEGDCTGVTNTDEVPKDHVQVNFQKAENTTEGIEFNLLVVRDNETYWDNIKYQA